LTVSKWLKTPKGYVTVALIALLAIASLGSWSVKGAGNALIAAAVCGAVDLLCARIGRKKRHMPDGAVVTGLIIALILSATAAWYVVAATSLLAVVSKYVLVYKKKPMFNPAAVGLLLSVVLMRSGQSWWGAFGDLPAWTIVFLLIGGYLVSKRVNKFPQVLSFLGVYFLALLAMRLLHAGDAADALRPPFINASLFFALFMLTDPPTSPAKYKDQFVFGVIAAIVSAVVYAAFGGLMYLFVGLFAGNLFHILRGRLAALREAGQPGRSRRKSQLSPGADKVKQGTGPIL
jgi:Na+-translocating ferredoxin:NAD+ oxidoreductase RnfD subunit